MEIIRRYRNGTLLEEYLNQVCEAVNNCGGHAHKNYGARTKSGAYISGEPFDYEIFLPDNGSGGKILVFDAKENFSGGLKWRI